MDAAKEIQSEAVIITDNTWRHAVVDNVYVKENKSIICI